MTDARLLTSPDDDDRRRVYGAAHPTPGHAAADGGHGRPGSRSAAAGTSAATSAPAGAGDRPGRAGGRPAPRVPWAEATGYEARRNARPTPTPSHPAPSAGADPTDDWAATGGTFAPGATWPGTDDASPPAPSGPPGPSGPPTRPVTAGDAERPAEQRWPTIDDRTWGAAPHTRQSSTGDRRRHPGVSGVAGASHTGVGQAAGAAEGRGSHQGLATAHVADAAAEPRLATTDRHAPGLAPGGAPADTASTAFRAGSSIGMPDAGGRGRRSSAVGADSGWTGDWTPEDGWDDDETAPRRTPRTSRRDADRVEPGGPHHGGGRSSLVTSGLAGRRSGTGPVGAGGTRHIEGSPGGSDRPGDSTAISSGSHALLGGTGGTSGLDPHRLGTSVHRHDGPGRASSEAGHGGTGEHQGGGLWGGGGLGRADSGRSGGIGGGEVGWSAGRRGGAGGGGGPGGRGGAGGRGAGGVGRRESGEQGGGTVATWERDRLVPAVRREGFDTGPHAAATARRGRADEDGPPALWGRPASERRRGRHPVLGALATVGVLAVGLAIGWVVLVVLRSPSPEASDALASRIDAAIAETMLAERALSFASWVASVATLLAIGGTLFRLFIVPPHQPVVDEDGVVRARSRTPGRADVGDGVLRGAATVGLVAALGMVPLRAMSLEGGRTAAALDPDDLWFVLSGRFGGSILLRVAGLAVLLVALADGPRSWGRPPRPVRTTRPDGSRQAVVRRPEPLLGRAERRRIVFVLGTLIVLASYSLIGHPQATAPQVVNVPAQLIHVTVAAAWFGGVTFLGVEMRHQWRTGSARYTAEVVARFSAMAEVTIVVAAVTGVVLANSQIHAPTAVLESAYGRAFVGKMVALGIVLAIGGYNQQKLVPAIVERDEPAAWDHLRRAVFVEVALIALGVLLMTAAMTSGGF